MPVKYNYNEERLKILRYLYLNRNSIEKLIQTKIQSYSKMSKPTFNRAVGWLEGANYIVIKVVGNANMYFITKEGISYLRISNGLEND